MPLTLPVPAHHAAPVHHRPAILRLGILSIVALLAALLAYPACAAPARPADATQVRVTEITDLRAVAAEAEERQLPILIVFSSAWCRYCRTLKTDFLQPMIFSGEYEDKILIRAVDLRAGRKITGFDGQPLRVTDLAARYRVRMTPTLIFINHRGTPVAETMVGLTTPDFFGGYLDTAIDTAFHHVRSGTFPACQSDPDTPAC